MNILYVINTLHKGGAEAHLLLLTRGLIEQGHRCEVAFLRESSAGGSIDLRGAFEDAGVRTHYLDCERSFDPRSGMRLGRVLAKRDWDILHSHLPRADAAAATCKLFNSHQLWISTVHHPYDNAYSGARFIPALAPMWRMADGVIAVSDPVRQWCIDRLGVRPEAVRTVMHGIELSEVPPATSTAAYRVGSIGRYEERKGHETLIRAMVPILREFPQARLKIAGHDPWGYGDTLRSLISELKLDDHVDLVGFMSDEKTFFASIDVFAFASLSEGFGIVILEAMAAGRPVVVSNIAPLNKIICPGKSGFVAECTDPESFAQAIISLFRDRARLDCIGAEGRRRVESEFSQTRMVQRTLQFYAEMLQNAGRVAP